MNEHRQTIAIIPARGGSKRIPRKNISPALGVPLIARTIRKMKKSGVFDRVVVSTDDVEIMEIALKAGGEVPFLREKEISDDTTGTISVIIDAMKRIQVEMDAQTVICCVYPFSVLIPITTVQNSYSKFKEYSEGFLSLVQEYPHPVQRSFELAENSKLVFNFPDAIGSRTQDLKSVYHDSGSLYWGRASTWLSSKSILGNSYGYVIGKNESVDLDDDDDLELLNALLRYRLECGSAEVIDETEFWTKNE